ncbi:hypothetical protein Tco_1251254 [Tanacetum coccineum]
MSPNSTNSNSNTNEADNTAYGVSDANTQSNLASRDNLSDAVICAFLASQPNSPQLAQEDLEQIDPDDLEEMDLQWEMLNLTGGYTVLMSGKTDLIKINNNPGVSPSANENYDSESDEEEPKFKKITINTDYKIKTSLEEPPTDLELKPLPDNLEYVFWEEPSFLPVIISS